MSTVVSEAQPEAWRVTLPESEYRTRLAKLHGYMDELQLDALLVTTSANIYYLTGYQNSGQDQFQGLIVPRDGSPYFVLRRLYFTAVASLSWVKRGTPVADTETNLSACIDALVALGLRRGRIGYDHEGLGLPPTILEGLRDALPDASFVRGGGLVERCRRIKSAREIELIRRSCALSVAGLEAAIAVARPGSSESEMMAAAYNAMIRGGSEFVSNQPIVVAGSRTPVRRTVTEGRPIEQGMSIWYEASASVGRYGGPIMRTISVGPASAELQRISDLMVRVLDRILAAAGPGVPSGEVDQAGRALVTEAGLSQHWLHRTGYSVGVSFPPSWVEGEVFDIKSGDTRCLEPGMVFHTVPWLLIPGIGSVGLSETWMVTNSGVEVLTDTPRGLRHS
jgi:Xaa-Pro dipeptidase